MCSGLNWIIAFIQSVAQQPQDPCCQQIVAALTAINSSLVSVFDQLATPQPQPPPPDFSGIIAELQCLCTAAQNYPAFVRDMVVYLGTQLAAIAAKEPPPVDTKSIADAVDRNTAMSDVPRAIFDQFVKDNAIPENYAAFLQGSPASWSDAIHHFLGWVSPPIDFVTHLIADDGDIKAAYRETRGDVAAHRAMAMKTLKSLAGLPAGSGPDDLKPLIDAWVKTSEGIISPTLGTALEEIKEALLPAGGAATTLGNVHVDPDAVVAKATGVALSASIATWLASYASIDGGPPLKDMAEKIAEMAGFEELKDLVIAAYSRHGVAAVVDMQARSLFRQHLPQGRDVTQWAARGLISAAETKRLLNFDGFSDEIQPPAVIAAQRGLNPRMLLQMILTGLFTPDDLGDEMTFSGIRPASQDRLKLASPYLATVKFRDATRASIEAAYVAGLLSDTDLTEQLDSIEHNTDRDNLVLVGSKWKKLTAITKDLEAQYATLFEAGLIDDATLHDHLQAIGLQPDVASAVAAKSEARANAALQRRTIADARALAKATAAEERRAATRSFVAGQIDLPALIVALTATGLTPIQAGAWSEIAQLQKTGTPRWLYGLRLPSEAATLLRSRVAALLDQRKRQLLSDPEFHDALASLGIPPEWINALRAQADAMITPKAAAILTPVTTSQS